MCGVFAITNAALAAKLTSLGLFSLQHRGQESAGIATVDGDKLFHHAGQGLVTDVFDERLFEKLPGRNAIGHVRYSTSGGNMQANVQPLTARIGGMPVAIAHNGNIVNDDDLRQGLENTGSILQGTADTEIILHLMARSARGSVADRLADAFRQLVGAFSVAILTPTHLYATVDSRGFRPLVLGRLADQQGRPGWVVASETCALDLVDARFIRDLKPGELLTIDLSTGDVQSVQLPLGQPMAYNSLPSRCVFEHIYFARPDSSLWGVTVQSARMEMGRLLALEHPVEADAVIAIPDSGVPMAMGYAQGSGIPWQVGLIRNHYVGRTFIDPTQEVRNLKVKLKLNPVREVVAGKRLVVVDDSIVRGTTSMKIIEILRDAGAREIHLRVGSPPVKYPCYYGIDTPRRKELLAQSMTVSEMAAYLKCDTLAFLSENHLAQSFQGLQKPGAEPLPSNQWCTACFTGNYPDRRGQRLGCPERMSQREEMP